MKKEFNLDFKNHKSEIFKILDMLDYNGCINNVSSIKISFNEEPNKCFVCENLLKEGDAFKHFVSVANNNVNLCYECYCNVPADLIEILHGDKNLNSVSISDLKSLVIILIHNMRNKFYQHIYYDTKPA